MEIKIKVPKWVNTDDEGICMLFAFLRKLTIEYPDTALDMYGYDMRRIMDREDNNLHEMLYDYIDTKYCKIAKLNREHFVFYMKKSKNGFKTIILRETRSHIVWAYLLGCSNFNLIEQSAGILKRPTYTPMYRFDRDLFEFTGRHYN